MGGMGGILLLTLLGASISGVVVASIAKILLPGKQRVSGIELFVIGTGAAWLGGIIAGLFGLGENRTFGWDDVGVLAIQVVIAAIAIFFWTNFRNKQIKQAVVPGPPGGKKDKDGQEGGMMPTGKDKDNKKKGTGMPGS
jgi:hypothetical protein